MKKTKLNQFIEYLSPALILSYFFQHNIFPVLIGIGFSLYLINIDIINNIKRSINNTFIIQKVSTESNKNDNKIHSNSGNIKSIKKDIELTLVEEIEELGFIPSLEKNNDSNAA